MKPEYRKGAEARKDFEDTMSKLFRVPKSEVVTQKPKPPTKKASEKKVN
jgi:hypothetical protein